MKSRNTATRFELLQLLGIDEVGVEGRRLERQVDLHQPQFALDQIVGQRGDAEMRLDRLVEPVDIVDPEHRAPRRAFAAAGGLEEIDVRQIWRRHAERQDRMLLEIVERLRGAATAQIFRRGIGVVMHGEELALDQVGLGRPAQPDRDIGLAHRQVELAVVEQHGDGDLGIELEELRDPGREPDRTEADRGGDPELAGRLVLRIGQPSAGGGKLGEDVMGGAVENLALLGENETPGMAVEQRHLEVLLERADLAADRRLRQAQIMAGMGEAAGIGHRVKDSELVPIHRPCTVLGTSTRRLRSSCHGVPATARPRAPPCSPSRQR